jgi:endoplasmic reticulum Man9GlcNAc2 1,2-alpha-mannosidase
MNTERDAMGADEYHPISHKGTNLSEAGGIGYTVVDAIDTMILMGLDDEYLRARSWIEHKLDFDRNASFSTFEVRFPFEFLRVAYSTMHGDLIHCERLQTTIRVLGGLLSAYHHSGGDSLFLERAQDLADRMLPVFDTPSGLPYPAVNLQQRVGLWAEENTPIVSTAEASTLQLEFRYLSELTDDDIYWKKAERVGLYRSGWQGLVVRMRYVYR